MKTTQKVNVTIDWNSGVATILEGYSPLKKLGCLFIEKDENGNIIGEELDAHINSTIEDDYMATTVVEFVKIRGQFIRVPNGGVSNRYNNQKMVLSDEVFLNVVTGELIKEKELAFENDLTKEIKDDDGNSYSPKQYEKKLKKDIYPAFSTFEAQTKFKDSIYKDMASRKDK